MKVLEGIVLKNSLPKTILVEVTRRVPHQFYKKLLKRSKTYKVHVEDATAVSVGQTVKIVATRPISKDKHFRLHQDKAGKEKK